jgi:glycosyltransferase involved in cell wall biosynthesis
MKPVGGFRVVYEYANRLSALGFDINLVHTAWLYKTNSFLEGVLRYLYCLFFYRSHKQWLPLDKAIKNKWIFAPIPLLIPDADFIIATSWETSEYVARFQPRKGKKLYIIQADESEFTYVIKKGQESRVVDSWSLPLHKIAICSWLQSRVSSPGNPASLVFNGLSFEEFFIEKAPETRTEHVIMMLYHFSPHKGCAEGLAALRLVKQKVPDLKFIMFGIPPAPAALEDWIEYYQLPARDKLRELYNRTNIFVSPSHSEGWGLPVAEAMQCGCAVVTTDIGGFKDFVKDEVTGLCFKVGDIEEMAMKIEQLIFNNDRRVELAKSGNAYIQQFTWERAVTDITKLLKTMD